MASTLLKVAIKIWPLVQPFAWKAWCLLRKNLGTWKTLTSGGDSGAPSVATSRDLPIRVRPLVGPSEAAQEGVSLDTTLTEGGSLSSVKNIKRCNVRLPQKNCPNTVISECRVVNSEYVVVTIHIRMLYFYVLYICLPYNWKFNKRIKEKKIKSVPVIF